MEGVTLFVTTYCPYCDMAKRYLEAMKVSYTTIDVTEDTERRNWLVRETGQRTVPQIFVGPESVGGFTDLRDLDRRGELTSLLDRHGIPWTARGH